MKLSALVVLTCLALFTGGSPSSTASPSPEAGGLTANGRVDPLGIPGATPVLGWKSSSSRRATPQTAYEIRVGSAAGKANVWRTGKVVSAQQVDVSYGGPALASATRYHWQVRIWDDKGVPSGWSAPAWFETGLPVGLEPHLINSFVLLRNLDLPGDPEVVRDNRRHCPYSCQGATLYFDN